MSGDEAVKVVQVQFLDIACFCRVAAPQSTSKSNKEKKLGNRVAACRVSVNAPSLHGVGRVVGALGSEASFAGSMLN